MNNPDPSEFTAAADPAEGGAPLPSRTSRPGPSYNAKAMLCTALALSAVGAYVYVHDVYWATQDAGWQALLMQVVADELAHEAGTVTGDGNLRIDYPSAATDQRELVKHLQTVLDAGDLAGILAATDDGRTASEEVSEIIRLLSNTQDQDEAREAISTAARRIADLQATFTRSIRHPIALERRSEPSEETWKSLEQSLLEYESAVGNLKDLVAWQDGTVMVDFRIDGEALEPAILQATTCCRLSRKAYMFLNTAEYPSERFEAAKDSFVANQRVAYQITSHLSDYVDKHGTDEDLKTALKKYKDSNLRRWTRFST